MGSDNMFYCYKVHTRYCLFSCFSFVCILLFLSLSIFMNISLDLYKRCESFCSLAVLLICARLKIAIGKLCASFCHVSEEMDFYFASLQEIACALWEWQGHSNCIFFGYCNNIIKQFWSYKLMNDNIYNILEIIKHLTSSPETISGI